MDLLKEIKHRIYKVSLVSLILFIIAILVIIYRDGSIKVNKLWTAFIVGMLWTASSFFYHSLSMTQKSECKSKLVGLQKDACVVAANLTKAATIDSVARALESKLPAEQTFIVQEAISSVASTLDSQTDMIGETVGDAANDVAAMVEVAEENQVPVKVLIEAIESEIADNQAIDRPDVITAPMQMHPTDISNPINNKAALFAEIKSRKPLSYTNTIEPRVVRRVTEATLLSQIQASPQLRKTNIDLTQPFPKSPNKQYGQMNETADQLRRIADANGHGENRDGLDDQSQSEWES